MSECLSPKFLAPKMFNKLHQLLVLLAYCNHSAQHRNATIPAVNYNSHFPVHSYVPGESTKRGGIPDHLKLYGKSRMDGNFWLGICPGYRGNKSANSRQIQLWFC